MSAITVWFIRFAILYFLAAMLIGIAMTMTGPIYPYMQIHAHFNLLGWMTMMIYGVGYHILPRFSGRPLWSDKLSYWHIWLANIGLWHDRGLVRRLMGLGARRTPRLCDDRGRVNDNVRT